MDWQVEGTKKPIRINGIGVEYIDAGDFGALLFSVHVEDAAKNPYTVPISFPHGLYPHNLAEYMKLNLQAGLLSLNAKINSDMGQD